MLLRAGFPRWKHRISDYGFKERSEIIMFAGGKCRRATNQGRSGADTGRCLRNDARSGVACEASIQMKNFPQFDRYRTVVRV
jgi:hypothetical protein